MGKGDVTTSGDESDSREELPSIEWRFGVVFTHKEYPEFVAAFAVHDDEFPAKACSVS
jgi:hypothetical protein